MIVSDLVSSMSRHSTALEMLGPSEASPDDTAGPGYVRVAAGVRAMIVEGSLRPGTWLRMQALADRFGVSVQPVREALQLLQGEGLVEIHPNRGAQIRGIDRRRLVHIYEIRGALESFMARQFADDASQSEIRALEAIQIGHDAATDQRDTAALIHHNTEFHGLINGRGGNREAVALIQRHYDLSSSIRWRIGLTDGYWRRVRAEHHELIDAFRRHDAAAAGDIGTRHVFGSLNELLAQLGRLDATPETAGHRVTREEGTKS